MELFAKAVVVVVLAAIDFTLYACVKAGAEADRRMENLQKSWRREGTNGEKDSQL